MRIERGLSPITNWHVETDETGQPKRYYIYAPVQEFDVLYELTRSGSKWHPRITADGHRTFSPLRGFDTAEDAHAAILKRCGML